MILAGVIVAGPKEKIETLELRKACEVTEVLTSGSEHENSILSELTIFCSCVTPTDGGWTFERNSRDWNSVRHVLVTDFLKDV